MRKAVGVVGLLAIAPAALALSMTDFAIFAGNETRLGANVYVGGGPVGSNNKITVGNYDDIIFSLMGGGVLFGGANLDINGNIIFNGNVNIGNYGNVEGNIDSGGNVDIGANALIGGNITASGKVELGNYTQVNGNILAGGNFKANSNVLVQGDVGTNGSATLGNYSHVLGHVTHQGPLNLAATASVGSESTGSVTVVPQTFSPVTIADPSVFTAGGANITKGNYQTTTLAPGTYGTISLGSNNSLYLSSGTYYFDALSAGNYLDLYLTFTGDEDILIYVVGDFQIGSNLDVFLTGADASDIYLETHRRFIVGNYGQWYGTVFAPYDRIEFGSTAIITGALYSTTLVDVGNYSTLNFVLAEHLGGGSGGGYIPEPATIALLGLGAAGLLLRRWRR